MPLLTIVNRGGVLHHTSRNFQRAVGVWSLLACLLVSTAAWAQSPVFDGDNTNVWILGPDGETRRTYSLQGEWTDAAFPDGSQIEIFFEDESSNVLFAPFSATEESVMVNQAWQSFPAPNPAFPRISLASFERAITDPDQDEKPGIIVDPPSGPFSRTVAVTLRAVEAPSTSGSAQFLLNWSINGGSTQTEERTERTIYLFDDDTYTINAWTTQDGKDGEVVERVISVSVPEGSRRDTDADGIPDLWEIENGLNPLVDSTAVDSDGDGWSDFDEVIRGTDPNDAGDRPADSDLDGWSDYDEILRNTNPDDPSELLDENHYFPDVPRARTLTEVEYVLTGSVFVHSGETVKQSPIGGLTVLDLEWNSAWDESKLPTAAQISAIGLPESALPIGRQPGKVALAYAAGDLPELRVPAGDSLVVRARHMPSDGSSAWVAKGWLESQPSLHPRDVTDYLAGLGTPWNTAAEWQNGWESYLAAGVVQAQTVSLTPETGPPLALLEGVIAWYDRREGENLFLLGDLRSVRAASAVEALRTDLFAKDARSLDEIVSDYQSLFAPGAELSGLAITISSWYTDPSLLDPLDSTGLLDLTTTAATSRLVQGDPANDVVLARYLSRLLLGVSLAEIAALSVGEQAILLDPAADFDSDGIANDEELGDEPEAASDPRIGDTDGDGIPDALDPCRREANNTCRAIEYLEMDSDGDGIIDSLDNCMLDANPAQLDSGGISDSVPDGIGDLCVRPANIRTPVSHLRLFVGQSANFTSLETEASVSPPLTYAWDFDGAAPNSTLADPGAVAFTIPGSFTISLSVTDGGGGGTTHPSETRQIIVQGAGPMVDAGGPYTQVEGQSLTLTASSSSPNGAIVDHTWAFGDGTPDASGNPLDHVFGSQGSYAVTVVATDVLSAIDSDSASVTIADSVPVASFQASPASATEFDFVDQSSAYDGILEWNWDFGDGTPSSMLQNPSHTYAVEGNYVVTLTVTDGDGSTDVFARNLGSSPVPLSPRVAWILAALLSMIGISQIQRLKRAR